MTGITGLRTFLGRMVTRGPRPLVFDDGVPDWAAARQASTGYDQEAILTQVSRATQSVIDGAAAFERDGVTFTDPIYRWPVAYGLMKSAQEHGHLRVLDVGGSLGSTYWQHRALLPDVEVQWTVLEQPAYVAEGRQRCGDVLTFVSAIDEIDHAHSWDFALFSSVLQYLDDPWGTLKAVLACGVDNLVIDRTPFHEASSDIPTVQHVPSHIYGASYPAWILSSQRLEEALAGWQILAEFPGIEPTMRTTSGIEFTWRGYVAERNQA